MKELIDRLERIAKVNGDEFSYNIKVTPGHKGVMYSFEVVETADDHTFIFVTDLSVDGIVKKATDDIKDACKTWGHKCVK